MKINNAILRISRNCNQNCVFCNVFEKKDELFIENLQDILVELKKLKEKGINGIILSGGEPTLNKDIFKIIHLIKKMGFEKIEMQTNAILFSDKNYQNLKIEKQIDRFLIPLYSHDKILSDKVTRTPDSFDKTITGIKYLLEKNKSVVINHMIFEQNHKDLLKFTAFYEKTFGNKPQLCISYIQPNGRAENKKGLIPKMSKISPELLECLKHLDAKKTNYFLSESCPPVCFIEPFRNKHTEFFKFSNNLLDYSTEINSTNKIKSPICKECKYNLKCLGIWKHYEEMFGFDEIKPIK